MDKLSGRRCASVVKTNWFKLNIKSCFSVNNRYRYLNVSARTNESILKYNKGEEIYSFQISHGREIQNIAQLVFVYFVVGNFMLRLY